ncbi:MAG: histidinol-phosphatase [Rhodospirillaceae bacterium]|nr:histidinol-phosphatase [Rhodospirillaceae bacterium]
MPGPAKGFAQSCIALAHELADLSGKITLAHFRTPLTVDAKADASPVTIADRDAESAMRERIARAFPDHGIVGEEHGADKPGAEWVWILDPIDGTKSFINGVPLFGTLIALWHQSSPGGGAPWLGCINHPALKERWIGGAGDATTLNGKPARARACAQVEEATLYLTGPEHFNDMDRASFARLEKRVRHRRFGGTDCYHYGMVASGWTDMACEADLKLHDYAAIVPVLEGAGAVVTDWSGAALTLDSYKRAGGRVLACGDKRVHAQAVATLTAA